MITEKDKEKLIEIFEGVKEAVRKSKGASRGGLMLGLQDLGTYKNGFVGAYFPIHSNIIVMNDLPIRRVLDNNPKLFEPYSFHILLHEYIHSLGVFDESSTRRITHEISFQTFGTEHIITEFSVNMQKFLPDLVYPSYGWEPNEEIRNEKIELVKGFDKSSTQNYIS